MTTDQQVADELAVRNLINKLAQLADYSPIDDLDEYMSCIAPDAVWNMGGSVINGADEIRAGAEARRRDGTQGPDVPTLHVIANTVVKVDGETATAESYFLIVGDVGTGSALVKRSGRYRDVFRRYADGWKFTARNAVFD